MGTYDTIEAAHVDFDTAESKRTKRVMHIDYCPTETTASAILAKTVYIAALSDTGIAAWCGKNGLAIEGMALERIIKSIEGMGALMVGASIQAVKYGWVPSLVYAISQKSGVSVPGVVRETESPRRHRNGKTPVARNVILRTFPRSRTDRRRGRQGPREAGEDDAQSRSYRGRE